LSDQQSVATDVGSQDEFAFWRTVSQENNQLVRDRASAARMVAAVITGRKRIQMICGPAGLGKNHLVETEAKRHGIKKVIYISPETPAALFRDLWQYRDAMFVCINENEKIAGSSTMMNMLKLATVPPYAISYGVNYLRNNALKDQPDPDVPPPQIQIRSGLIWLANDDFTDDNNIKPAMREHWGALLDRGINPRLLRTGGDQALFEYVLDLMLNQNFLRNLQLKLDDANAVLRTVVLNAEYMQTLTPRSVELLALSRRNLNIDGRLSDSDWQFEVEARLAQKQMRRLNLPLLERDDGTRYPMPWCSIIKPSARTILANGS
jgi:hypothetical protein